MKTKSIKIHAETYRRFMKLSIAKTVPFDTILQDALLKYLSEVEHG